MNRAGKGDHWSLGVWLFAMDVLRAVGLGFTRPYYWCIERASDATDWGT